MWCFYGLKYATDCACLHNTSMLMRGLSLLVTNSLYCMWCKIIVIMWLFLNKKIISRESKAEQWAVANHELL
jgi:hypothetical protein